MLPISYRNALKKDLLEIARVFIAAFPDSIDHYKASHIKLAAIADIFNICLDAEPDAFYVAAMDDRIAGYIFAPSRFSNLSRIAVSHGHIFILIWRWITEQYGIGIIPVSIAIRNWLSLLCESKDNSSGIDARILSIAVDPDYQGKQIGTNLMKLALDHLRSLKVDRVRLEVRPDNLPARHVYEKYGFRTIGETEDTQGDWLIMVKNLCDDT